VTELQAFLAMLERVWVAHGTRPDYDPPGTAVQVEHLEDAGDDEYWVTDWAFDADGRLVDVEHYRGGPG